MRFNIFLPMTRALSDASSLTRVAQEAEALGFEYAKLGDHLVYPRVMESSYPYSKDGSWPVDVSSPKMDAMTVFSFLAGRTETLRFSTSIMALPLRSPLELAKNVATLDQLSGGRLTLGLGVGWMTDEYKIARVPFRERGAIMDEYLAALRTLFDTGGPFDGRYISFPELIVDPLPVQRPFPLHLGSVRPNERALRRMARFAQGWLTSSTPVEVVRATLPRLHNLLEEEGRGGEPFEVHGVVAIGSKKKDEVLREVAELGEIGYTALTARIGEFTVTDIDRLLGSMHWVASEVLPDAKDL